ncbi:MAG: GxxExxY protein [Gemmatimonadaceae bacterium]
MDSRDPLTGKIIGAAITVSKALGNGLFESVYETCLAYELTKQGFDVSSHPALPVVYDGLRMELAFRPDLIVHRTVIVEVKAVNALLPVHQAQLLNYLRLSKLRVGLLINFHSVPFSEGIVRMVF